MAEDWNAIAEEVAAEIADIGFEVIVSQPSTVNIGTLADPSYGQNIDVPVAAIERMTKKRDSEGVILGVVKSLLIPVGTVTPEKGWRVQVRGRWHRINEVYPLAPGGVDLMFRVELES